MCSLLGRGRAARPGQKRTTGKKPKEITAWGVNEYANGLRRGLQNRNFIQWRNTLGNTQRITKLLVGGYCSCLFLLFSNRLFLVPFRTLGSLPYLSFLFFSFFLFFPSDRGRDLAVRLAFRRGGLSSYHECLRFALRWSIK